MAVFRSGSVARTIRGRVGNIVARSQQTSGVLYPHLARRKPRTRLQLIRDVAHSDIERGWQALSPADAAAWTEAADYDGPFGDLPPFQHGGGHALYVRTQATAVQLNGSLIPAPSPPEPLVTEALRLDTWTNADRSKLKLLLAAEWNPPAFGFAWHGVYISRPNPNNRRSTRKQTRYVVTLDDDDVFAMFTGTPILVDPPFPLPEGARFEVYANGYNEYSAPHEPNRFAVALPPPGQTLGTRWRTPFITDGVARITLPAGGPLTYIGDTADPGGSTDVFNIGPTTTLANVLSWLGASPRFVEFRDTAASPSSIDANRLYSFDINETRYDRPYVPLFLLPP